MVFASLNFIIVNPIVSIVLMQKLVGVVKQDFLRIRKEPVVHAHPIVMSVLKKKSVITVLKVIILMILDHVLHVVPIVQSAQTAT